MCVRHATPLGTCYHQYLLFIVYMGEMIEELFFAGNIIHYCFLMTLNDYKDWKRTLTLYTCKENFDIVHVQRCGNENIKRKDRDTANYQEGEHRHHP